VVLFAPSSCRRSSAISSSASHRPSRHGVDPEHGGSAHAGRDRRRLSEFSIGLEFSLPKLVTMRRTVFGLGAAQVAATMALVVGVALTLGISWRSALVLGGALAMSSTAILAKLLAERLELNSAHGRQIMGILLFQDLAVVPLLILVPALSASTERIFLDSASRLRRRSSCWLAAVRGTTRDARVVSRRRAAEISSSSS